jgi:hypothetical protein
MVRVFGAQHLKIIDQISYLGKTVTVFSGSIPEIIATIDDTGEYMNNPSTSIGYLIVDPDWELMKFFCRVNPNGRWLFLLTKTIKVPEIRSSLSAVWNQNNMLNTFVVTSGTPITRLFFYNPFLGQDDGLIETKIYQFNIQYQLKQLDQNLKRRFKNLQQHPLNISIQIRPLITTNSPYKNFTAVDVSNGVFLDYILQFLNASAQEQPDGRYLNNGHLLANGSLSGILKMIDERVVEISVYNRLVTNLGKCNVAYLRSVERAPLLYILHKRQPVSTDVLFSVFHRNAVVYQVGFLVWAAFTWWLVEISTIDAKRRSLVRVTLDLASILCNIGIKETHSSQSYRIVFAMVLLYAFIANNVYQGQVVSKLNSPLRTNDPQTIDQLLKTDIPLTSYIRSNDLYPAYNQTTYNQSQLQRVANRNVFEDNYTVNAKLLQDMLSGEKDVAVLMKMLSAQGVRAGHHDPQTNGDIVHVVPESPISFLTAHTVRRDSPFLTVYNELILQALENGFKIYGERALELNNYLGHLRRYKQTKPPLEMQKITLQNVKLLFRLWMVAMLAASVVFAIELVTKKMACIPALNRHLKNLTRS